MFGNCLGKGFSHTRHCRNVCLDLRAGDGSPLPGTIEVGKDIREVYQVFDLERGVCGCPDESELIETREHFGAKLSGAGDGSAFLETAPVLSQCRAGAIPGHTKAFWSAHGVVPVPVET